MRFLLTFPFAFLLCLTSCKEESSTSNSRSPRSPEVSKVGLLPLGSFPEADLLLARDSLSAYYKFDFVLLSAIEHPEMAWYPPRSRYRADSILVFLYEMRPDTLERIMALTTKDISTTKGEYADWGIMGLARLPGRTAVVSTFRIKRGAKDRAHFVERYARVVKHEFGHSLGLPHCPSRDCFMRDAEGKVSTLDEESGKLCLSCRQMVALELRNQ